MKTEFLTTKYNTIELAKKYRIKINYYAVVYNHKTIVGFFPYSVISMLKILIVARKTNHVVIGIWKAKKIKEIDRKPLEYEVSISNFSPPVDTSLKREIPQHLMQKKTFLGSYVGDFIDQNHFKNYLP